MSNGNTRGNISIAGGWLGTYRYGGVHTFLPQVRFEASIKSASHDDSNLYGEIVDDGPLGVASLSGNQHGIVVHFSKRYKTIKSEVAGNAEYAGLVSDDGTMMRGTWRITVNVKNIVVAPAIGTWEARRMWSEAEESATLIEGNPLRAILSEEMSEAW